MKSQRPGLSSLHPLFPFSVMLSVGFAVCSPTLTSVLGGLVKEVLEALLASLPWEHTAKSQAPVTSDTSPDPIPRLQSLLP